MQTETSVAKLEIFHMYEITKISVLTVGFHRTAKLRKMTNEK